MHVAAQASADLARVSSQTWQNKICLAVEQKKTNSDHKARTQEASILSHKYTIITHQICNLGRALLNSKNCGAACIGSSRICPNTGQNSCPRHQRKPSVHISPFFLEKPFPEQAFSYHFSFCVDEIHVWKGVKYWMGLRWKLKRRRGTQGRTIQHRYYILHKTPKHLK